MHRIITFLLVLTCIISASDLFGQERTLAFPGADGYGRFVTGGRGGEVCYVTRLDDCSDQNLVEGTLRWAIRHDNGGRPRTILFATSGTIYLTSKLKFQYPNVSILGQTAPGGGITITGYNMYICRNNVIVRYLRFRAGDIPNQSMTGLDLENAKGVILDHCSMTWSMEECLTAYDTDSTTIQWCIIGEGLYNSKNSKGSRAYATQWGGEHSTMHHTLITNSHSRAPRFNGVRAPSSFKGEHDYQVDSEFANNVVFNWSGAGNQYGGEYDKSKVEVNFWTKNDPGYNRVYLLNNFYRPGPATKRNCGSKRYWCAPSTPYGQWYLNGNKFEVGGTYSTNSGVWSSTELNKVNEDNYYGAKEGNSSRGIDLTGNNFSTHAMNSLPYALSGMEYESADEAYQHVVTLAGASLPRYDEVDTRLLGEAAGTIEPRFHGPSINELGIIDSPSDITLTYPDTYVVNGLVYHDMPRMFFEGTDLYFIDSDADGMPDGYEDDHGLNKDDASDGAALADNGYTNLENYLNAVADLQIAPNAYCTSTTFVYPGPQQEAPETITYSFSKGDVMCEGNAPSPIVAQYGSPITIPTNQTLYREGYTLTQWINGTTIVTPGQQHSSTHDVTFSPIFEKNLLWLDDRKEDVTLTWDFTTSGAPTLLSGSGIFVTQASCSEVVLDVMLTYSNNVLTFPACPEASYTLVGNTTVTGTADSDIVSIEAPEGLTSVTVTLPALVPPAPPSSGQAVVLWAWDGQQTDAETTPAGIFSNANCTIGDKLSVTGESKAFGKAFLGLQASETAAEPDPDCALTFVYFPTDGIDFQPEQLSFSAVKQGTDMGRWTVTIQQGSGEEQTIVSELNPARNNADTYTAAGYDLTPHATSSAAMTVVRFYLTNANPNKVYGLADIQISGSFEGQVPQAKQYTFDATANPSAAASITWSPTGNSFDEGTTLTVKAVTNAGYYFIEWTDQDGKTVGTKPELTITLNTDTQLTAQCKGKEDFGYVFDEMNAPYDAVVRNAVELNLALEAAASRQDKEQRYRIFLHNGTYDLGTKAKTAIPAMTSLIGESQEGVLVLNNPGKVSNYQDQTPVLYIDQNQNDVYLQDLTIRQDRDWAAKKSQGQAIALRQRGKRAVYKNVTLQGIQDTYYLNKADGTAYFESSTIAGEVDFIYGDGTAWFEQCLLCPVSANACITAPNTQTGYKGFVFDHCTIEGATGYRLGRPWSDSPAATYLYTTMRSQPQSAGWGSMTSGLKLRFHEYGSMDAAGNLLDLSNRSTSACSPASGSDEPVLTQAEAEAYTLGSVFTNWNPQSLTQQMPAPTLNLNDGEWDYTWQPVADAIGYAVCVDGQVTCFTTLCAIDSTSLADGAISIRAINAMGGLGEPASAVSDLGIVAIPSDSLRNPVFYNLQGQIVSPQHQSGIYISNGRLIMLSK